MTDSLTYSTSELESLAKALEDGKWHLAREIQGNTGITPRKVRSIAEHAGLLISGNDGYKLTALATIPELQHSVRSLFSRSRKIDERACKLSAVINERLM